MILCISPNAGLDRVMVVPGFAVAGVFRAAHLLVMASGKGINVARAIARLDGEATATAMLGGETGARIAALTAAEGLKGIWTPIDGETRTNIIIVDPDSGAATVINEQGPRVSAGDWARFQADAVRAAQQTPPAAITVSGSVPPGVTPDAFESFLAALTDPGCPVWVDTSGEPLHAALRIAQGRFAIKVNGEEVSAILGSPARDVQSARAAARALRDRGAAAAVLTLGARGAVYAAEDGEWFAETAPIRPVSAVGSGDSFMAGLLLSFARGAPTGDALRCAAAAGAANALSPGSGIFSREDFKSALATSRATPL